ncbi:MAG: hypothetical protein PHW55_11425 [Methanothrix sp.]|nr:hypothetical protein [Methanothrix sp.]
MPNARKISWGNPITLKTTTKGEKHLEDLLDGEANEFGLNLFEEALLKYIHNGNGHTMSFSYLSRQVGIKGVDALGYAR